MYAQYFFTPTAILHTDAFFPKRIINTLPPFSPITAQNCSQGDPRQLHCIELPLSSYFLANPRALSQVPKIGWRWIRGVIDEEGGKERSV